MLRISITHTLALPRTCSVSNIHTRTFTHLHVACTQPERNAACLCSLSRINHTLTHIHVALMQPMLSLVCSCSVSHTHLRTPVSHTHTYCTCAYSRTVVLKSAHTPCHKHIHVALSQPMETHLLVVFITHSHTYVHIPPRRPHAAHVIPRACSPFLRLIHVH